MLAFWLKTRTSLKTRVALAVTAIMAALLLAACGSDQPAVSSNIINPVTVGVAPAVTGAIGVETTYAAVVQAKEEVDLVPMTTGRVLDLAVDVGSVVSQGQIIAELKNVALETQLQQAMATLRDAQAKLASAQAALGPQQAKAMAQLDAALAAQEQLTNPSSTSLQSAHSAVSTSQSKLDSFRLKLDLLMSPSASDIQAADSAVATAQSNVDSANTRLNQLLNPSASDLQAAQGRVATAQSKLDGKQRILDQLLSPTAAVTAAAQEAVSDAQSKLSSAQANVNDAISAALAGGTIESALTQSWEGLLSARLGEQANVAILLNPALSSTLTQDETDAIQQLVLDYQQSIASNLSKITSVSVMPEDVNTAMLSENSVQTALDTAQEELKELQNPEENVIAVARNDVAAEQAALESALANLEELQNADENTITLAQNELAKATAALESAKTDLAELQDPSATSIALAQADVDSAQASLDAAKANLALLTNPKKADLAAAEALVAAAREKHAMTQPPLSDYALEVSKAAVDRAQAQVDSAAQQVEELKILTPFDGVVTRKHLAPGAMASMQTPVATVASSQVVVELRVEETAINSLDTGRSVVFTSPALSGQDLELVVDRISPAGEEQSFTFLVMLSPTGTHLGLKAGMSGQVAIGTSLENAVLVPQASIIRQEGQPALFVVKDNRAHLKLVGIGLSDGKNVEIRTGITPGERVVVSGHNLLSEGDPVSVEGASTAANQG